MNNKSQKKIAISIRSIALLAMLQLVVFDIANAQEERVELDPTPKIIRIFPSQNINQRELTEIIPGVSDARFTVQVRKLSGQGPLSARIEVIRPDGSVLAARDVTTINRQYDNNPDVTLTASSEALRIPTCGTWRVRFSKRGENSANGEATIHRSYSFASIVNGVPMFGVTQGNEVEQNIPDPSHIGLLSITAEWDSHMINSGGIDVGGLKLTFRLFRGNTLVSSSTGYGWNAFLGQANPKMAINHRVTTAQINSGSNWKVRVKGSSGGDAWNIKVKTTLSLACR